jgi:uncharacterized protein (TIGR03086 family)
MDALAQLDELMPQLMGIVDGITAEQLGDPTPCASYDVRGVLEHMVGGASTFAPAFRGETPDPGGSDAAATTDIRDRWRAAMVDLGGAVQSHGAMDRTIDSPFGPVPGADFARYLAFDGLMHGWDLATATGQKFAPRDELVASIATYARGLLTPEMRDGDTFAAETAPPPDASPLERLVAFSGRTIPT